LRISSDICRGTARGDGVRNSECVVNLHVCGPLGLPTLGEVTAAGASYIGDGVEFGIRWDKCGYFLGKRVRLFVAGDASVTWGPVDL
jgi:hypothetical protein